MATKAKVKTRPAPKAAPVLPDSCGVALTKKQVSHAMSITTRCLDTMIARGDYPRPDFHIGPLPRWRVETHNTWLEKQGSNHAGGVQTQG